jgi:gamma-glutamyltranspeptidase/glutathione hydrolase
VLEQWHKSADALSRRAHFPESKGEIPQVGEPWLQKDLAKFLRRLGDEGPDAFYNGDIAQTIIRQVRAHGGILSLEDLATYRARDVEPLRIDYRGHTIVTPPPPSGGLVALQILKTLEHFDLASLDPYSAPYLHLVAETCKACWVDRAKVGDPDFIKLNYEDFLAPLLASSRAAQIRREDIRTGVEARIDDFPHTCNVSIVDKDGNVVSLTATQGAQFGSGVVIEGLGLVLGHGMSRFEYNKPGHPNSPAPSKRPMHNMCPMLIFKDDKPIAAVGMPGGTRIPSVTAQLAISLIDFAATPEQCVHATRVHSEGPEPLIVSKTIEPQIARELESLGHTLTYGDHALGVPLMVGGPANVIRINEDGTPSAASTAAVNAAAVVPDADDKGQN